MSVSHMVHINNSQVPKPLNGVHVTLGSKFADIETGCLISYNGYRVATRVALYRHSDDSLNLMTAESFVNWAKTQPRSQGIIEEYIYSCPPVPSAPLTYSKLQLRIEQAQIVVFENNKNSTKRLRFGILSEDSISLSNKPQEFIDLFDSPSLYDWIYYRLRDVIDNTHVPNISSGRFNGIIDGKSIMGESTDPKWGKRSRLLTTPKVLSDLDSHIPYINVFTGNKCEQNPLNDPALLFKNWEVDKEDWVKFLKSNRVPATNLEIEDLYYAINAGNLIGHPHHKLMSINKRDKSTFWRPAHQGDKIVGMGNAIVNGESQEAIIKGTVLDWPCGKVDYIAADAYKGTTPNTVNSRISYSYTTEYMSKGVQESTLPLSVYTYVEHEHQIDDIQDILNGENLELLINSMTYFDEDGNPLSTKAADALSMSKLGMKIPSIWNSNGVDQHILSLIRNKMSKTELTLWKVLSFTIGKGLDELYVPLEETYKARRKIAAKLANQTKYSSEILQDIWGNLTIDEFKNEINEQDLKVILFTVPVLPGIHTSHILRVWESDTIGLNPRLALSLLRDSDGDLACCLFPSG